MLAKPWVWMGLSHCAHGLRLLLPADFLVGGALDDAACFGQLGADAHEVGVDVTGGLAAFVDAPVCCVSGTVFRGSNDRKGGKGLWDTRQEEKW